jgi:ketosteroid isomerase-like protein
MPQPRPKNRLRRRRNVGRVSASPNNPDVAQIERLVHAYTERVADGDLEAIADLFIHGGVSGDTHPEPAIGRAAVLELYRATLSASSDGPRRLRVVTTDLQIEFATTANIATCASRFTVYPSDPNMAGTVLFEGRYLDEFASFDGQWAFTRRHVALDMTNHEAVEREGVHLE